ncbi:hypothetical protein [Thermogemmatispora sp.]|uniref:hypothetical protein n=1 Tax=Thermogemmatispora sp. TaxID=1968838 RepID=UPI001D8BD2B2|nr:hypothetical protein [Thermogemmatispora sp.]MBX5450415.1 hypothetical protein [Thermogemmatispora sp.]
MSHKNLLPFSSLWRRQSWFRFNRVSLGEGLLVLGVLALLLSVFLPWRYTTLSRPGEPVLVLSGWQTGLLGGQGLCLLAIVVLVPLLALRRWLAPGQHIGWKIAAVVLLGGITLVTAKDALDFYSGSPLSAEIKLSVLGAGFYVAMLGLYLLFLACFLLVRQRQRQESTSQEPER